MPGARSPWRDASVSFFTVGDAEMMVLSAPVRPHPWPAQLTPAEQDVAARAIAGESNARIAAARGTSLRTVANQVASVFRKLGVASRHELRVRRARTPGSESGERTESADAGSRGRDGLAGHTVGGRGRRCDTDATRRAANDSPAKDESSP